MACLVVICHRALSVRGVVNISLSNLAVEVDTHRRLPSKFVDLDNTDMGSLGKLTLRKSFA